jgi:hypothetical protein
MLRSNVKISKEVSVAAVMAETVDIWNKSQIPRALCSMSSDGEICEIFFVIL